MGMGVLVEEVVEVLPHVVRRLFVEFFSFFCCYLYKFIIGRNVVPRMSIERAVAI